MLKILALRFTVALFLVLGCGAGVAHADAFPYVFNFGVGASTYTFETYSLTQDISVHCLAGCAPWTYVNYLPQENEIQLGSIDDTSGLPYAEYSFNSNFFTLGSHSDGIYSMSVTQVPEPTPLALLVIGLLGIAGIGRYRTSSVSI
jgi:hypothetical protein